HLRPTLFPSTTLVRSPPFALLQARRHVEPETARLAALNATDEDLVALREALARNVADNRAADGNRFVGDRLLHIRIAEASQNARSEEHTSELQSRFDL